MSGERIMESMRPMRERSNGLGGPRLLSHQYNTPGWWGGAHPFALLDCSVVHNGEISSYDANRRCMEIFGYRCTLQTDTEVITYIADYLLRVQGRTLEELASVIAAPFWGIMEKCPEEEREKLLYLRKAFSGLLITGPLSIVLNFNVGTLGQAVFRTTAVNSKRGIKP